MSNAALKGEELKEFRVKLLFDLEGIKFIRFKGACLVSEGKGFNRLQNEWFANKCYDTFGTGISERAIAELQHAIESTAPDWDEYDKYISFLDQVWDMEELEFVQQGNIVYRTDLVLQPLQSKGTIAARNFLLQLANGDEGICNDLLQSMAPLFMKRRPAGVVWFVGDGANGKSSLLNALYRVLKPYFSHLTTADIEDGKLTPALRGVLGNIVLEGSEVRVHDAERYKAIGTHEEFVIRKFRTHSPIVIKADFHTIFNANNIPIFSDKSTGPRRRTLIVPFKARFKDDPTFEDRTFTPEFLGGLFTLILEETRVIRDNNYQYKWSDATVEAKSAYDSEVNSAEAFVEHLLDKNVVGFINYKRLMFSYEDYCATEGLEPLRISTLKKVIRNAASASRYSMRDTNGNTTNRYSIFNADMEDSVLWFDNGFAVKKSAEVLTSDQLELGKDKLSGW